MIHGLISIVAELPRDEEQSATDAIDQLGNPLKEPLATIVGDINRIHFFSITVVPSDEKTIPYLVFELSVDGEVSSLLNTLASQAGEQLEPIFKLTKDFGSESLTSYWQSHSVKTGFGYRDVPGVAHIGSPGMTVERINKEATLAQQTRDIVNHCTGRGSALAKLDSVRAELRKDVDNDWAFTPEPAPLLQGEKSSDVISSILSSLPSFIATYLWPFMLIAFVCALVMAWPLSFGSGGSIGMTLVNLLLVTAGIGTLLSIAFLVWVYAGLRSLEQRDAADDSSPDFEALSQVRNREDHTQQNHLAGVSIMKGGFIRQITLRLMFWLIALFATKAYRPGFLGSIGTIHFARWLMVPGSNRLLFFSNYGGSWESYLEDFINKANIGLTGVWSNTLGFPKSNNLVFGGASDGDRFKRWARRQQQPTWCWYSAYPHLTTENIRTNAAIRQGLAGISTETEARDWLSLFGSQVLPRTELQSDNIQALMFGGFGRLPHATCLTLQLPRKLDHARAWLAAITPQISFGDYRPESGTAMVMSLSAPGLRKLGLNDKEMSGFAHAFVQGMAERARILGDNGKHAPSKWLWGGNKTVDAALLMYAEDAESLAQLVQKQEQDLDALGGKLVYRLPIKTLPSKGTPFREPFGFVDGVSQPIIRGIGRHKASVDKQHIIEPGEFILGYPDGLGTYPHTPKVPAISDAFNDLYTEPEHWPKQRPNFVNSLATEQRDLGRDGSYMVIRQLEQNVEGFNAYLEKAAEQLNQGAAGIKASAAWIGAKLVGRWQDGSSLVRNPHEQASNSDPNAKPDNDFLFGKEDPQGLQCPFGSHIRRTNPRDSQAPKSPQQLAITNRHRILRAGRSYQDGDSQGLLFVCFNGDIERQFEFIQQTWVRNSAFHGLQNEIDPLFNREDSGEYSIPMANGSRRLCDVASFVTVRGGEYFFLPGRQALAFLARSR